MLRSVAVTLLLAAAAHAETLSLPRDSPRWQLEGEAKVAEYQGRKAIRLDGGDAIVKDFAMRDGIIDVDVATTGKRGFFGFDVRIGILIFGAKLEGGGCRPLRRS
jgi:hypothetical protein